MSVQVLGPHVDGQVTDGTDGAPSDIKVPVPVPRLRATDRWVRCHLAEDLADELSR